MEHDNRIPCTKCGKPIKAPAILDVLYVKNGKPYCSEECADDPQLELPLDFSTVPRAILIS